jgi:hypothetical protein
LFPFGGLIPVSKFVSIIEIVKCGLFLAWVDRIFVFK